MTKSFVAAVAAAVALAVGSYAVSPSAAAQDKPTVSREAAKPLKAAQDAANAKKFDETIARSLETLALPKATAYDKYTANKFLAFAYSNKGDSASLAKVMEAQLGSEYLTGAERTRTLDNLARLFYQQKNYARATELWRQLIAAGGGTTDTYTMVAQSYYQQKDFRDTVKFLGDYVAGQERAGQTPKEQHLQLISDSYLQLSDRSNNTATLEKLVRYYPKPIYWNNVLYTLLRGDGITDKHTLQIYRLMQDTGTLKQPNDYTEMAQISMDQGTPGEAVSVLEAGMAANVFSDKAIKDRNQRLLDSAKKQAAADKAGLAKFEAEAKAAKNGEVDVALGRGYLSYGMNAQAEEALARGISKGSLKLPADAQILLGVAQLRQKKNADAVKTFNGVKASDATMERIAKLWALHGS